MTLINLKKIINRTDLKIVINQTAELVNSSICIQQANGEILMGTVPHPESSTAKHPITVAGKLIGWVFGDEKSAVLASVISYAAKQEYDKKSLAKELLEKYEEIDLLQNISTRINASLDAYEVAEYLIQEAVSLLDSDYGFIYLLDSKTYNFNLLAKVGSICCLQQSVILSQRILNILLEKGEGTIINDIAIEPTLTDCNDLLSSVICVPLKTKEKIIGVIAVSRKSLINYTTEHLNILTLLASQTSTALEKGLLYKRSCEAAKNAQEKAEKLQQALEQLQQAQAQLVQSEKMSSLGKMVAGIAHEINNPVSFIYGNLEYFDQYVHDLLSLLSLYQKNYPKPVAEIEETIEAIELDFLLKDLPQLFSSVKIGTNRIKEIVASLRNFSHLGQAEKKLVDLHEGIDNTLLILNHRLKGEKNQSEIQVIKEYGDLPNIECYPGQLNQVFMNILSNAIDAIIEFNIAPKTATIRISTQVVNCDWVEIQIADNGPGIPEKILNKIYDPFFTTKPIGKGTGLGMAISHQIIVEKHGGILKCISETGKGTEFLIQIPIHLSLINQAKEIKNTDLNQLISLSEKDTEFIDMESIQ
ncbi:MAG: ATP-binding protein [Microcoleaceae cyanobacterium]